MTNELARVIEKRIGSIAVELSAIASMLEPLRKLKGKRNETTPLYACLKRRQGIYFLLQNESWDSVVYVGRTEDGINENGLADRLWGHLSSTSALRLRLREKGINVDDCFVAALEVQNRQKRIQMEHLAIGIFEPVANVG